MTRPSVIRTENLAPVRPTRKIVHEALCQHAEAEFKRIGECDPVFVVAIGHCVSWIVTPWENLREKRASHELVHDLIRHFNAHAYGFVSEVWMMRLDETTPEAKRRKLIAQANRDGISSLPPEYRDDVLAVYSFDSESSTLSHYLVTASRHGLNFLGPRVDLGDDFRTAGPMANILKAEAS